MIPIWVLVNCNNAEEATGIGDKVLEKRLGSCYDIFSRELTKYFWPPKSKKIESAKGALLIIETFEKKYEQLRPFVEKLHSDELPFIGFVRIEGTGDAYKEWIKGELAG